MKFYANVNYLLELNGKPAGRINSVSVVDAKAEVIDHATFDGVHVKRITTPSMNEIMFTCGPGMSRDFFDWLKDTFVNVSNLRSGAIIAIDAKGKEAYRVNFFDALIESVLMPPLDRLSAGSAHMFLKIRADRTQTVRDGKDSKQGVYGPGNSKAWDSKSFRLSISGLESETADVTSVGGLGVGVKLIADDSGSSRDYVLHPGSTTFPNLAINLPLSSADGLIKWASSVSENRQRVSKTGSLEYRGHNSKTPYFNLDFDALLPMQVSLDKRGGDAVKQVAIEFVYDSVKFSAQSSAVL